LNNKLLNIHFRTLGQTDLSRVHVTGVREAYEKYKDIKESKGVKAHFQLDENGLLIIDRVRVICNINFREKKNSFF